MKRFTTYQDGEAVLIEGLNENQIKQAIEKLAQFEDLEEEAMKRAVEIYVSHEPDRKQRERIEVLELKTMTYNILKSKGIDYIDQLCALSPYVLLKWRHFGNKALEEVQAKLSMHGRKLGE